MLELLVTTYDGHWFGVILSSAITYDDNDGGGGERGGAVRTVLSFIDWAAPALSSTKWSKPLDGGSANSCCSELLTLRPRFIDVVARASLISSCLRMLPCRLMLFLILMLPALVKLTIPVTILDAPDLMEDLNDLCASYTIIHTYIVALH